MNNFLKIIRRISSYLTIAIIILPVLLKAWKNFEPITPLPIFLDVTDKLVNITFIAQLIFLPVLFISTLRIWIKIGLGLLFIPNCLFFLILFLQSTDRIAGSVMVDQCNIHLIDSLNGIDARTDYYLYECDANNLNCKKIENYYLAAPSEGYNTELLVNNHDVFVYVNFRSPDYTYLDYIYEDASKNCQSLQNSSK